MSQRFQAQPLQPLQKRDSQFSKVSTCFEAQLGLLEPELSDQRDYTLVVENERGQQAATVRLRVSSPLSPMLMISSAFVTICGLFLCSLVVMFVLKKRPRGPGSGSSELGAGATTAHMLNGKKAVLNGVEHLAHGGLQNGAAAAQAAALAQAAVAANAQLMQQQTRNGVVNGTGNGLANQASNPACGSLSSLADDTKAAAQAIMMSMGAGSDSSSAGDQRQLLVSTCSSSSPSHTGQLSSAAGSSVSSAAARRSLGRHGPASTASSSLSADQPGSDEARERTPTPRMAHISLEDEGEPRRDLEQSADEQQELSVHLHSRAHFEHQREPDQTNALIYANIDYQADQQASLDSMPRSSLRHLRRQQAASDEANHSNTGSIRSSVGQTIAMMNSLAAQQQQQQPTAHSGVLNGAINQQLANSRQLVRKPGPPKPPKPSIQQRSRFYQQQQQSQAAGLVMIGHQLDVQDLALHGQYQHQLQPSPSDQATSELAAEYSRIAFPARAEL